VAISKHAVIANLVVTALALLGGVFTRPSAWAIPGERSRAPTALLPRRRHPPRPGRRARPIPLAALLVALLVAIAVLAVAVALVTRGWPETSTASHPAVARACADRRAVNGRLGRRRR
jgi:multisubunit Na+/H+ antiporter MnhC subunit